MKFSKNFILISSFKCKCDILNIVDKIERKIFKGGLINELVQKFKN